MSITGVTDVIIISNNEVTNQKDNQLSSCKHAPHSTILDYYAYFLSSAVLPDKWINIPDPVILAKQDRECVLEALMIPAIIKRTCVCYKYARMKGETASGSTQLNQDLLRFK